MSKLRVGFGSTIINPELGAPIFGYYVPRFAKGILDDLHAAAIAFEFGTEIIVMVSVDNGGLVKSTVEEITREIERAVGISGEKIIISSTHTHTAPFAQHSDMFVMDCQAVDKYRSLLIGKIIDAVRLAISDIKPAKMGYATVRAPERIAYIRRYRMKDGSIQTCPPVNDENILAPIGELDNRVNVVRLDREGENSIIIVNYGLHADTIGGELISADFIHWLKKTVSLTLGAECVCFVGAQGDVGSTNPHPTESDMNDTEISFDNEMKSPGMARFVGRALAGSVLQAYDKVQWCEVDKIGIIKRTLRVPANVPSPADLPRAREYKRLHEEGRDDLIPYEAMELTTVVAEAVRMCRMENGPEYYDLPFSAACIGNVAFVGIPGEPFTEIGMKIKQTEGFDMICPTINTNAKEGYFPSKSAFAEGGYEARTSPYTPVIADAVVDFSKELLNELK